MSIESIVDVQVSNTGAQVQQAGFGVPLILDAHDHFPERVRYYTEADALLDDGFTTDSPAYLAAQKLMSQSPRVVRFAVGRRANAPLLAFEISPTLKAGATYELGVNGQTVRHVPEPGDTLADLCSDLETLLDAVPGFTVGSTASTVTITATAAGNWCRVSAPNPELLAVKQTHADPGVVDDLVACAAESNDWYAVTLTTSGEAEILAAAAWVESNKRIMVTHTQDAGVVNDAPAGATDVAAQLEAGDYFRSAALWHHDNGAFSAVAWLGSTMPKDPGSSTFKFRRLAGVEASRLTETQQGNARAKNANTYTTVGGIGITAEGVVASGEFIDRVRDGDWFTARTQERVFGVLANADKVPFTDHGIATIESELRAQIQEAITAGFLTDDPEPVITVPRARNVPRPDREARRLTGISFEARVASAVHAVTIRGRITV